MLSRREAAGIEHEDLVDVLQDVYGEDTLWEWRRSMHAKPPPMDESHPHWRPPPAPLTESLADCQKRTLEWYCRLRPDLAIIHSILWRSFTVSCPPLAWLLDPSFTSSPTSPPHRHSFYETIMPALLDEEGLPTPPDERVVIVVAHSNTIRSLMAYLDDVPEEVSTLLAPF